ncbi:MAG: ABC transporter substrate-binding protein [Tissierellia bacterium]|nr:ABC transporter substrate-binding protein [Tissierellia bacterium]
MKKKLAVLLAAIMLLTACGNAATNGNENETNTEGDSVIIRGIICKTGPAAVYGNTTENGILLAIEEINAEGGINGKLIDYKSDDDKADPTESVTLYNKFVDEGAHAIVGPITSKPAQAVAENSVSDGIPIVTPTGTAAGITEGKDNVFRVCFTDPLQGKILANFAKNSLGATTAAVMKNTSDDYSTGVAEAFKTQFESIGGEVVADEGYGKDDKDFRVQLTNIAAKNPDVVLIPEYYENDVLISAQAKDTGLESAIIGSDGWDGVLAVVAEGEESTFDNICFTNHYSMQDTDELVQNFVKNYTEKYGEDPSSFSALGYDAVYIYKAAIEKAENLERETIVEAIKNVDYKGVTGNIKFGENNNPIKPATIIRILDGEYTFDSVVDPE